jgi:TatD DNase family protein
MRLIDTHSHIYLDKFTNDIDDVINRAKDANITDIYLPNIDSESIKDMDLLCEKFDCCHAMMGLHPCSVDLNYKETLQSFYKLFASGNYVGVGEVGIDLYWEKKYFDEQKKAFDIQIAWGKEMDLPIIIHSRDSLDITIEMISKQQNGSLKGIFHCFNGTEDQAKKIIDTGFLMGIGGVLTYKNSGLDKVVSNIDLEHLVLETDAPYLTPVPYRGKRNEPSYIKIIAENLAEIKNFDVEEIAKVTTASALSLFHNTPN